MRGTGRLQARRDRWAVLVPKLKDQGKHVGKNTSVRRKRSKKKTTLLQGDMRSKILSTRGFSLVKMIDKKKEGILVLARETQGAAGSSPTTENGTAANQKISSVKGEALPRRKRSS